jgi:hypothetical protein
MTIAKTAKLSSTRFLAIASVFLFALAAALSGPALAQTSGTWSSTGALNTPRTGHTATLLANGEVLVVGGEDSAGVLTTAELYNPTTGTWSTTGSLATPRYQHSATLLPNGEVLVAGGYIPSLAEFTATAELYNPSTGKWTTTGSMTMPRASAGAALLPNGQVLVAGGVNATSTSGTTAELYNPATGKWTATGGLTVQVIAPATLLSGGLVLMASTGGHLYNPSAGSWTSTSAFYYPGVSGVTSAALLNGDAVIFGNHLPSYTSEYYNPVTNVWSRTLGQNYTGVDFGPMVTLANGNVLLAGGSTVYNGKSSLSARSAIYNPSTNTWTSTGSLRVATNHAIVRLQSGKVLAVGKSDAELYTP